MKMFHCKSVSLFSIGKILNAYILYQSFHLGYIFKTSVTQWARWIITQIVLHFSDKLLKDKVRSFHDTLFPVFESCNNVSKCFMSYYDYFIDFVIFLITFDSFRSSSLLLQYFLPDLEFHKHCKPSLLNLKIILK